VGGAGYLVRADRAVLVHVCLPMATAWMIITVYNIIDAVVIGSLHDTALLAAITFGVQLPALVMAVGRLFGTGGGALVARLLGAAANEPAKAGERHHRRRSSNAVHGFRDR
jgi:multidrug efflux pump